MRRRIARLNQLLREVIAEVIQRDLKHPDVTSLITVTVVLVNDDVEHAKVYVSLLGDEAKVKKTFEALQNSAGFIAVAASKKVSLRYFPQLHFKIDDSLKRAYRIEELLQKVLPKDNQE